MLVVVGVSTPTLNQAAPRPDRPTDTIPRRILASLFFVPCTQVGHGHYGVVRRAIRRSDGANVAVKTIAKRRAVYVDMLRREVRRTK